MRETAVTMRCMVSAAPASVYKRTARSYSAQGVRRVSLETGTMDAFAPARSLYADAGFVPCGPFGDYVQSPSSAFMTMEL